MKNKFFIAILALCLVFSFATHAEGLEVKAMGEATVSLQADMANFTIGIRTQNKDLSIAQCKNKKDMAKLVQTLKDLGIEEKDILTSSYNVDFTSDYMNPDAEPTYIINNMLYVILRDINSLDVVLDKAMQSGANTLWSLNFTSSKQNEAYEKALEIAVKKARHNAEILAKAEGREIGSVIKINHIYSGPAQFGVLNNMDMVASKGEAAGGFVTGDVSVSASVEISYELKPAPIMP
ncbi:MAG: SIMPL domain-containing protein [Eubacteriales bacterium]|nr:SIMPL domain-containing protein [Eubacteriales bacterium]